MIYLLVAAAFIFVPHGWREFRTSFHERNVLSRADREDYLASLHNATDVGCYNLARFRPAVVFAGDSHAYAAIDYMEAGRHFGDRGVGHCALPGAFLPSISLFLDWLGQSSYRPDTLIYVTSPRQFMALPARETRLSQHQTLLFDPSKEQQATAKWLDDQYAGKPVFGRNAAVESEKLDASRDQIEKLDEARLTRVVSRSPQAADWQRIVPTWQWAPRLDQEIASLCGRIRRLGIKLFLIHAPEAPIAQSVYSLEQWQQYSAILAKFDCASRALILTSADLGLGNRHFINRYAAPDFNYGIFDRDAKFSEKEWAVVFDMDHPNRLGAELITREIIDFVEE